MSAIGGPQARSKGMLAVILALAAAIDAVQALGQQEKRFITLPAFDAGRFRPVGGLRAVADSRRLQLNVNASLAVFVSNENRVPDDPLAVSFTPNNRTMNMTFMGNALDPYSDCQAPSFTMPCRGNWFVPPSLPLAFSAGNPTGCPQISGDIASNNPNPDLQQFGTCYQQPLQTITCNVAGALEDAFDLMGADWACVGLRAFNWTCGAGGLLRVYWVVDGTMYQPAALMVPFYGNFLDMQTCFRIPTPPTPTSTVTATRTASSTASITATASTTSTGTVSATVSMSLSATASATLVSATGSNTASVTFTASPSGMTATPTRSMTASPVSATPTASGITQSQTPAPSVSRSFSPSASNSRTMAPTVSPTGTATPPNTPSQTPTASDLRPLVSAYAHAQEVANNASAAVDALQQELDRLRAEAANVTNVTAAAAVIPPGTVSAETFTVVTAALAGSTLLLLLLALFCCCWWVIVPWCRRRRERKRERAAAAAKEAEGGKGAGGVIAGSTTPDGRMALAAALRTGYGGHARMRDFTPARRSVRPGGRTSTAAFAASAAMRRSIAPVATGGAGAVTPSFASDEPGSIELPSRPRSVRPASTAYPGHAAQPYEYSYNYDDPAASTGATGVAEDASDSTDLLHQASRGAWGGAAARASSRSYAPMATYGADYAAQSPYGAAALSPEGEAGSDDDGDDTGPIDAVAAAYMGVDEHTGEVLNKAAALAYEQFVHFGVNYSDAYKHYAAWFEEHGDADTSPDSVLSGTAGAASAEAAETPIAAPRAARRSAHYTAAAELRRSGRGWRSKAKRGMLLPTKDAPPPPRRLVIGAGVLKGTVVDREAVQLRKVERIRGDRAFKGNASDFSFEAVKGRREVVTPTPRAAALAQAASAAASGYANGSDAGSGPASAFSPGFHA